MDFFASFNADTLRLKLRLASTRIELLISKKVNEIKKQKLDVAALLRAGNEELARIRTEHLVREDFNIEVLNILRLLCSLCQERTKLLEASDKIPYDMKESIVTIVFAADRVPDIPELKDIKKQFMLKFKKELQALVDTPAKQQENVNERVFDKLSMKPPNANVVSMYMQTIAEDNNVSWTGPKTGDRDYRFDAPPSAPSGFTVQPGAGTGITSPYLVSTGTISTNPTPGIYSPPPPPVSEPVFSSSKPAGSGSGGGAGGGGGDDGIVIPPMFPTSNVILPPSPPSGTGALGRATQEAAVAAAERRKKEQQAAAAATTTAALVPPVPPGLAVGSDQDNVPTLSDLERRFQALNSGR